MMRMLTSHLQWKAASFLIALAREPELVTSHAVPVFFKNLPRAVGEVGRL